MNWKKKKLSEYNLFKIQKQLTYNQEEMKINKSLLDDFKKKDNSKTANALEEKQGESETDGANKH